MGELNPEAAVVVATIRALKLHGGAKKGELTEPNPEAVERGFGNLARHLENVAKFGVPTMVAINRFLSDTDEEVEVVRSGCVSLGAKVALCDVWEQGGAGGIELAQAVIETLDAGGAQFTPLYDTKLSIMEKIERVAKEIYGADGVSYTPKASRAAERLAAFGLGETPVCMAKTQYSFTDDASKLGAPSGFTVSVRDITPSAGAGFVVALTGDIMTMPGLGKTPAAEKMRLGKDGTIEGLF